MQGTRRAETPAPQHLRMLTRVLLACALAATWCLSGAQPALAHGALVATTPSASAVLSAPPAQVLLEFTEPPVQRSSRIRVRDPEGREHPSATLFSTSGEVLAVLPDPGGPDGTWSVDYRAEFVDGHVLTGTLTYAVGRTADGAEAAGPRAGNAGFFASLLLILGLGFGVAARAMSVARSGGEP